jgi:hypothetical protein
MKQLMPCEMIFSHFSFILFFSAASMSATWRQQQQQRQRGSNPYLKETTPICQQ